MLPTSGRTHLIVLCCNINIDGFSLHITLEQAKLQEAVIGGGGGKCHQVMADMTILYVTSNGLRRNLAVKLPWTYYWHIHLVAFLWLQWQCSYTLLSSLTVMGLEGFLGLLCGLDKQMVCMWKIMEDNSRKQTTTYNNRWISTAPEILHI